MYNVTNAFLAAARTDAQEQRITGSIGGFSFNNDHIIDGSFHITNQCTDTDDVVLGSVFLGQLECTFTGIEIGYSNWIGKVITPSFGLKLLNGTWEDIPLGVFTVIEAKHSAEGVSVVANDNMYKFDKKFKKGRFQMTGGLWAYISQACSDCGVTFGMTDEELETFPNGDEVFEMFGVWGKYKDFANDIATYRDLIFWIAQTLGSFATINRAGELIFKRYTGTTVDEVDEDYRLDGAVFADYITNYTGIYVTNMDDNSQSYYGYDVALLTAEISLVTADIASTQAELVQNQSDIVNNRAQQAENDRKYRAGEITEEEYLRKRSELLVALAELQEQRKVLNKHLKQQQKRLTWLQKALVKAQNEEEGTYMELGSNPFLQSEFFTDKERERRAVLGALDPISYTPFSCSSILGAHYDLGDVIYFTGGHAGTDGCFCCLMSYDFTFHNEYYMQGFGVDPIIANTKTKDQKAIGAAQTDALNASGDGGFIVAARNPVKIVTYTGVD